jgi:hypothetical protein
LQAEEVVVMMEVEPVAVAVLCITQVKRLHLVPIQLQWVVVEQQPLGIRQMV